MAKKYWKEEEGYDTYNTDNGFCVYAIDNGEYFIAHFFVDSRKGGGSFKFFKQVKEHAKSLGASFITGNVDFNENNKDNYTKKLMVHLRNGYEILDVSNNRITVIYYL